MPTKILYQIAQMDNGAVFNKEVNFRLENYGKIKMMFLIFEVNLSSTPPESLAVPFPSSPYLIESVDLQSFGNTIASLNTSYLLGRYDEEDQDLYKQILEGSNLPSPLLTTGTVSLPLYFWTIDGQVLDTYKYQNLTIRCTTKSSLAEMGMAGNGVISSLNVKLKVIYDQQSMERYTPVTLKNPYNVYRYSSIIPIDSTSASIKLNVPYKVCNLYFMLRSVVNAKTKKQINSIKLTSPTGEIGTYDGISNYYLGEKNSANMSNTFAIQMHSRYKEDEYMSINGQQNPLIAELTFGLLEANYKLYVSYEYYSNIVESSDGMLIEDNTRSFVRS